MVILIIKIFKSEFVNVLVKLFSETLKSCTLVRLPLLLSNAICPTDALMTLRRLDIIDILSNHSGNKWLLINVLKNQKLSE